MLDQIQCKKKYEFRHKICHKCHKSKNLAKLKKKTDDLVDVHLEGVDLMAQTALLPVALKLSVMRAGRSCAAGQKRLRKHPKKSTVELKKL